MKTQDAGELVGTESQPTGETITLERTGLPPLQFTGVLLAHASGQFVNTAADKPNNDWWEVSLFRVVSLRAFSRPLANYVVAVTYHNEKRNRYTHRSAFAANDPARRLAEYDPLAVLVNFPPDATFKGRQAHLERMCRQQWEKLLSAVLTAFPEVVT